MKKHRFFLPYRCSSNLNQVWTILFQIFLYSTKYGKTKLAMRRKTFNQKIWVLFLNYSNHLLCVQNRSFKGRLKGICSLYYIFRSPNNFSTPKSQDGYNFTYSFFIVFFFKINLLNLLRSNLRVATILCTQSFGVWQRVSWLLKKIILLFLKKKNLFVSILSCSF